mmetsp:Transcript_27290/g.60403  ORF Transcript_27290/g.60403 Transcript_27290/m.60403 type:complete len:520 (+) Transcript_27290:126-1685(+)
MRKVVHKCERLTHCIDVEQAIKISVSGICETLDCERATLWMIDTVRQLMWTRVANTSNDGEVTITAPLAQRSDTATAGIVNKAYVSGETLNVPDAYLEPAFNTQVDRDTGFRTKSMLTVPVKDSNGSISVVVQAVNKRDAPQFSNDDEFFALVLGSVAVKVLRSCEANSSTSFTARRQDLMMLLGEEMLALVATPVELFQCIDDAVHDMFKMMRTQFYIIGNDVDTTSGSSTSDTTIRKVVWKSDSKIVEVMDPVALTGLVGQCVRERQRLTCYCRGMTRTAHAEAAFHAHRKPLGWNPDIDIEIPSQSTCMLHTVPVFTSAMITLVVQFIVLEPEKRSFGDDGSFNCLNQGHISLLDQLLQYCNHFLTSFFPPCSATKLSMLRYAHLVARSNGVLGPPVDDGNYTPIPECFSGVHAIATEAVGTRPILIQDLPSVVQAMTAGIQNGIDKTENPEDCPSPVLGLAQQNPTQDALSQEGSLQLTVEHAEYSVFEGRTVEPMVVISSGIGGDPRFSLPAKT